MVQETKHLPVSDLIKNIQNKYKLSPHLLANKYYIIQHDGAHKRRHERSFLRCNRVCQGELYVSVELKPM